MGNYIDEIQKENQIVDNSNTDSSDNQYLGDETPRQELKLKESNTDFISDENLQALKEMNFCTDKDKIGFVDLLNWLPKTIPGICSPAPQICYNHLYMFSELGDENIVEYTFLYGEITHQFAKSEASDFRITYELSKQTPAYIVSTNPLEGILNMVVWVLENCVNNYSYQTWIRGWCFTDNNFKNDVYQSFKNILGKIEDDEYKVNDKFTDLGFIIKNPHKK